DFGVDGSQGDISNAHHAQTDVHGVAVFVGSGSSFASVIGALAAGTRDGFLSRRDAWIGFEALDVGHYANHFLAEQNSFAVHHAFERVPDVRIDGTCFHFSIADGRLDSLAGKDVAGDRNTALRSHGVGSGPEIKRVLVAARALHEEGNGFVVKS